MIRPPQWDAVVVAITVGEGLSYRPAGFRFIFIPFGPITRVQIGWACAGPFGFLRHR
jgi:hypothetical protein